MRVTRGFCVRIRYDLYLQLAGQVENYLQDISLNKIRRNPNSSTLQKAAMQIGKWPYFRILGGFTLHY